MISIPRDFLHQINTAAAAAYPRECCGLLAGIRRENGDIAVTRVQASRNIASDDRPDRFEIDPETRFALMRDIGEFDSPDLDTLPDGERIVGHYHSHPDHPAKPSDYDLKMAFEPDLFWLIVSVMDGRAANTTIHLFDDTSRSFQEISFTAW